MRKNDNILKLYQVNDDGQWTKIQATFWIFPIKNNYIFAHKLHNHKQRFLLKWKKDLVNNEKIIISTIHLFGVRGTYAGEQ